MAKANPFENREIDFPDPKHFNDPFSARSAIADQSWLVSHSTRSCWQGKRNVKLSIVPSQGKIWRELRAQYTYKELESEDLHTDIVDAKRWGVLGRGKVGRLTSWMHQDGDSIDVGDRIVADWRTDWAILVVMNEQGTSEGLDVLTKCLWKSEGITDAINHVNLQSFAPTKSHPEDLTELITDDEITTVQGYHDWINANTKPRVYSADDRKRIEELMAISRKQVEDARRQAEQNPGPETYFGPDDYPKRQPRSDSKSTRSGCSLM